MYLKVCRFFKAQEKHSGSLLHFLATFSHLALLNKKLVLSSCSQALSNYQLVSEVSQQPTSDKLLRCAGDVRLHQEGKGKLIHLILTVCEKETKDIGWRGVVRLYLEQMNNVMRPVDTTLTILLQGDHLFIYIC
ncbi:hypothetical protein ILYODFUR_000887 [Ilyodon furcidens]|uniref:Uncharacterized protein n=1 Tax=Ilyodon furcidens TaxID=33524 RepID=A0ABV0STD5_9TELE